MKRSKKRRNHQKIANNYLGMAAIAIVVLILLVGLTMQSNNLKARIAVIRMRRQLRLSNPSRMSRTGRKRSMSRRNICRPMNISQKLREISLVSSKETRSFLKKRSNIRNKADFAEKFFLTAAFV